MVRKLKKNAARFISLMIAVFMVLSLLPISELVFAATENHPDAVTISVVDENGEAVTGATVTFKVHSTLLGEYVVPESQKAVDEDGVVEVMSSSTFEGYTEGDLKLTATATADKYEAGELGGSIESEIIAEGTASFTINLKSKTLDDVSAVENTDATELVYSGNEITLVTVSAKEGDTVEILVDGKNEEGYPKALTADDSLTVKRTNAGEYTVNVTIKRDGYFDKEFNFEKITIAKKEITEGITFEKKLLNYDGSEQAIVEFSGANDTDDIYWKIGSNDEYKADDNSHIPVETAIGSYDVYVRIERGINEIFEKTVTSTIDLGLLDLTGIDISPNDLTYNGSDMALLAVNANPNNYNLSFITAEVSSTDNKDNDDANWKEWNDTQFPQGKNAGNYTVWVKVSNGDDYEQNQFADDPNTEEKEYPFYVEIKKAEQTISVDMDQQVVYNESGEIVCGFNGSIPAEDIAGDEVDVEYTIAEDSSGTAEVVNDDETYKIKYTQPGTVKVCAKVKERPNYEEKTSDPFEINIDYADFDAGISTVPVNNGYYDTENGIQWADEYGVTVFATGWEISLDNSLGQSEGWSDNISVTDEGDYSEYTVAFKNASGEITDKITVPHFAIDATNPILQPTIPDKNQFGIEFEQKNDGVFANLLNFLTFGSFFNERLEVTVNAEDAGSGISGYKITLYAGDSTVYESVWSEGKKFSIDASVIENFKGNVKVEVMDNVAHITEFVVLTDNSNLTDTSVMIENDKPVINAELIGKSYEKDTDTKIFNNAFDLKFVVDDNQAGKEISGVNYVEVKVKSFTPDEEAEEIVETEEIVYEKDYSGSESKTETTEELSVAISFNFDENTVKINETQEKIYDDHDTYVFDEDGKIELSIYAVDNSGNVAEPKIIEAYLDKTSPEIKGFDFSLSESETIEPDTIDAEKEESIYKAVDVDDYGFYFKQDVYVTVTAEDKKGVNEFASGVKSIKVAAVDYENNKYTVKEIEGKKVLAQIDKWDEIEEHNTDGEITFTVFANFKGQIFAFATDNIGNDPTNSKFDVAEAINGEDIDSRSILDGLEGYVYPNGSVLETEEHHTEVEKDHITITVPDTKYTQNNGIPLYADNVDVTVSVKDEFAGIREITWDVSSNQDKNNNYSGKLTVSNDGKIDYGESSKEIDWSIDKKDINLATLISNTLIVENNSNDITVTVTLKDRAGNTSTDSVIFGIDKTIPTIDISYDNNSHDKIYTDFYKADRTATVTITERNFRAGDVEFEFTNTDGWVPGIDLKSESAWQTVKDTKNPDNTKHIAKFTYNHDGEYTFSIDYKDNAENAAEGKNDKFTIDKTIPTVTVVYDNNDAQNGNYYKADRIATITINEHNFDAGRVKIIGTPKEAFPTLSKWQNAGDKHVATLAYTADSLYTFDIEIIDKAGNSIANFKKQEFTIDKTNPVLEISGIADKSANSGKGNIGFTVSATDTNFDVFEPVITAVQYIEGKFETSKINPGVMGDIANGRQYRVANIETDGIYRITCTVVDKAGNAYSEVILEKANGGKYTENRSGNDVLLTFSVNRDGSVFYVDGYTKKLLKDFYVQNVTEDVQINEVNADTIVEKTITVNGKPLIEGDDYAVTLDKSEGTWYRYVYSINKSVFKSEGEYSIVVSSKDRAKNQAFSDIKNISAKFVVDRTAPTVTIAGLKSDGRYRTDKQVVTVVPSDDGGLLSKLIIRTVDEDGKVIKELINLEGEALLEAVEAGNITFELGEGLYQNVEIICEDAAGNVIGENAAGELYENVSVSTNAFLIFWANKVARYLAIAGVALVFGGVGTFAVLKKKKAF